MFKACISVDNSNPQIEILKQKSLITSGDIDNVLSKVDVDLDENKINNTLSKHTVSKLKEIIKNINSQLNNKSKSISIGKKKNQN